MLKLAADENFDNRIVQGLLHRKADLDILSIQEAGLSGVDDPAVLEWATREGRILLTHDKRTLTRYVYERVQVGRPTSGVFVIRQKSSPRVVIEDILLLLEAGFAHEWDGQIMYIPL